MNNGINTLNQTATGIGEVISSAANWVYDNALAPGALEGSDDGCNTGGVSFGRGMTILGATVTLATGGLGFEAGLAIKSLPGIITTASMVNAVDDLGAVTNTDGNSILKQSTFGNLQKSIGLAKTAITIADLGVNISGLKDGLKGMDALSILSGGNDLLTGILPSAKQTVSDVKSLLNNNTTNSSETQNNNIKSSEERKHDDINKQY